MKHEERFRARVHCGDNTGLLLIFLLFLCFWIRDNFTHRSWDPFMKDKRDAMDTKSSPSQCFQCIEHCVIKAPLQFARASAFALCLPGP